MRSAAISILAFVSSGCGGLNYEPLSVLYPNDGAAVSLGTVGGAVSSSFSTSNPFFQINSTVAISPAAGFVADVTTDASGFVVAVYHSTRLQSRFTVLSTASVRKGDYVSAGSTLGTSVGTFRFAVTRDGAVSCPFFDLSAAARTAMSVTGANCLN
jgi:hypothetical protein